MNRKKNYIFIAIVVLAFLAGCLVEPKYFNSAADFLNSKAGLSIPHFWDVPFKLGLDLQGGTHLIYEADLSSIEKDNYDSAMQGLRDIIERRVNLFGIAEPVVQVQEASGQQRLIVELAGIKDPAEAIKMIGQTPFLEFKTERSEEETNAILEKQKELEGKTMEEALNIDNYQLAFEDPYFVSSELTGKYLERAEIGFDQNTNNPYISLQFNDEGSKIFADLTSKNIGKSVAIYIDNSLLSAPVVQEEITGGRAQITGQFTVQEAKDLAKNLNAGALPVPIKLISQQSIGPSLGAISLNQSLIAGIFGFLAVVVFMIAIYRLPGFLASIALAIYILLVLALFKLIPVTLTLAGIGGFILSIGMAVDANILIFARMKEELNNGRNLLAAIEEGFRRAWPSIRDSNFNSLIVCLILFNFATSFIKGFALTLGLGIILSMFSAIIITKILLLVFVRPSLEKHKWIL